jgi:hypothetical protein
LPTQKTALRGGFNFLKKRGNYEQYLSKPKRKNPVRFGNGSRRQTGEMKAIQKSVENGEELLSQTLKK